MNNLNILQFSFFLILPFYTINNSFAQTNDTIYWSHSVQLKRSDFNLKIANECAKHNALAMCFNSIKTKGFIENKLPNYNIKVYFLKSKSCARDTSSLLYLKHEQLHFDISELYARKMRRTISIIRHFHFSSFKLYQHFLKRINSKCDLYQDRYDSETDHSLRINNQKKWEKKIDDELNKLKEYSSDITERTIQNK